MRNDAMERNVKVGCGPVDEEIDNATSRARARARACDKTRDIVSRTTIRCIVSLFRFLSLSLSLSGCCIKYVRCVLQSSSLRIVQREERRLQLAKMANSRSAFAPFPFPRAEAAPSIARCFVTHSRQPREIKSYFSVCSSVIF